MSTRDETHEDFAWEAGTSEQDTPVAENSPDGESKTRASSQPHRSSTPAGRNGRPTPAAIEERRARQALTETRGRASSSTIDPPRDLHTPGELWALAVDYLERAAVCLKSAAHRTDNTAAGTIGHREVEQLQMMLARVRPEQHVIDTHGARR